MRVIIAIFFGLVALGGLLAGLADLSASPPAEVISVAIYFLQVPLYSVLACYWARPLEKWNAAMICPSCGQCGTLTEQELGRPRPSLLAMIVGGVILTLVAQHARVRRFRCEQCSAESWRRTVGSWVALAWVVVTVLIIAVELLLAA